MFEGKTTGAPIALIIHNTDQRSKDYSSIKDTFRPGHADYTYYKKYGLRDYRGGGRSSARETAMRVAAGAIAKKYLQERYGILIRGYLAQLGPIKIDQGPDHEGGQFDWDEVENNPFFCPDAAKVPEMDASLKLTSRRSSPDSLQNLTRELSSSLGDNTDIAADRKSVV